MIYGIATPHSFPPSPGHSLLQSASPKSLGESTSRSSHPAEATFDRVAVARSSKARRSLRGVPWLRLRHGRMADPVAATLLLTAVLRIVPQAHAAAIPALAAVQPVTICQAQGDADKDFTSRTSGLIGASYACTTVCQADWRRCLRLTQHAEHYGRRLPKVELPFVVDDMAGVLRFALRTAPTITFHSGAGGTFFPGEGRWFAGEGQGLIERLEEAGVRVVEVRWAWGRPPGSGWLTRKAGEAGSSLHAKVGRPASLLKWVRANLVGRQPFGTYGCSGGAVQTLAAAMWYAGVDEAVDYQFVSSMPLWDIGRLCTDKDDGVCEHEPSRGCHPSAPCPNGARCGYPFTPLIAVRALVDELHGTRLKCTTERYDPAFDASSLARVPATRYALHHPVDFSLNVYKTSHPLAGGEDDLRIGAFWQGAQAYAAVRQASPAGNIRLTINEHYGHCADGAEALVPATVQRIKQGMHLPATAPPPTFHAGDFCHLLDASMPMPQGFAAPYETTKAGTPLAVAASCTAEAVTVYVGTGSENQLIYGTGYIGREGDADWRPIALSGEAADGTAKSWHRGLAAAHVPIPADDLARTHYLLTYICTWTPAAGILPGGRWQCGCQDEACATPRWTIQGFRGQ
jgi:hypothetical protein